MRSVNSLFRSHRIRNWIYPVSNYRQRQTRLLRRKRLFVFLIAFAFLLPLLKFLVLDFYLKASSDLINNLWDSLKWSSIVGTAAILYYIIYWYVTNRPKHIIQRFSYPEGTPELKSLSSKATDMFIDSLRNIDSLLSLRQVENVLNKPDNLLAMVITSGQHQERIKELTSSVYVDAAGIKFSFDNLLSFILFSLAKTRIHGTVQWRQDGDLEVSIEIAKRDGNSLNASRVINVDSSTGFIRDTVLNSKLKELATEIVMKLGQRNLPASSWENLRDFLGGLEASAQRNWWHSIALYRHVIRKEESTRGEFGIGHYHLGSMLVSQGEPVRGLEHLRIAEKSGFPSADTYYMIALTLFYIYQNDLHRPSDSNKKSNQDALSTGSPLLWIDQIDIYCARASSLKKEFPEVYQLRGTAHYQVGKLMQRKSIQFSANHYREAIRNLKKATKQYGKIIDDLPHESQPQESGGDRERLIKNYITATHRLAAASRSLKNFGRAEAYYQEIREVIHANIQTLVDLAKTYCLAAKWTEAEDLFKKKILYLDGAIWNVDVSFYRGWAVAGKLALAYTKGSQSNDQIIQFRKAFQYLDYALYQRPRYISSWEQTQWEKPLRIVAGLLKNKYAESADSPDGTMAENLAGEHWTDRISNIDHWLWLRIDSYYDSEEPKLQQYNDGRSPLLGQQFSSDQIPFPELSEVYRGLKLLRKRTKKLLKSIDELGYVGGVRNHWIRLTWAQHAYKTWEDAGNCITLKGSSRDTVDTDTFGYRWAIDVYAEIAMLACRLLAECHVYEHLLTVATDTSTFLENWLKAWTDKQKNIRWQRKNGIRDNNDEESFEFSSRVLGHQIASCYAWKAYALLQQNNNPETRARRNGSAVQNQDDLIKSQESINQAFSHRPFHPLAVYVQAQIYRTNKLNRLAIDRLTFLLSLVEPFDPKTFFDNTGRQSKAHANVESSSDRIYYYYMERVCGQQQFEDFIDRTRIHAELAKLLTLEDDIKPSVEHYLMALTWSPYKDMDVKNLLRLSNRLYRLGRFDEAFSVIQEIHARRQDMMLPSSSAIKGQEAEIMECILHTRLNNHSYALEKGLSLSRALAKPHFNDLTKLFSHLSDPGELEQYFEDVGYDETERKVLIHSDHVGLESCFKKASKLISNKLNDPNLESHLHDVFTVLTKIGTVAGKLFPTPDKVLLRAVLLLNVANLSVLLENDPDLAQTSSTITDDSEKFRVMVSHLLHFLCKKALNILIQEADIANNIAYNQAELRIDIDNKKAVQRSLYSIAILEFVADCIGDPSRRPLTNKGSNERIVSTKIKNLKSEGNYREKYGELISGQQIAEKLALYYDTLGWIYFRNRDYAPATESLRTALLYYANGMSAHYHLARVLLTRYENLWQSQSKTDQLFNTKAEDISKYLRDAFHHVNRAQELDGVKRFESKILLLKGKIKKYREHWDDIQLTYTPNVPKTTQQK